MAEAKFMGVPEDAVLAVGKVTIAAGLLEEVAQEIDHALGGQPGRKQFREVVREIRERLPGAVPGYARVDADTIYRWAEQAVSAIDNRDRWSHSAYKQIAREGGWRRPLSTYGPVSTPRSRKRRPGTPSDCAPSLMRASIT